MNIWITRALRTGLLTAGLLVTGAGIASASDGIDVTAPVTITGNAVGVLGDAWATDPAPAPAPASDPVIFASCRADTACRPAQDEDHRGVRPRGQASCRPARRVVDDLRKIAVRGGRTQRDGSSRGRATRVTA